MELEATGAPVHSRTLSVRIAEADGGAWSVQGVVLDLRRRGLVPMAGDLQTAGVIHHMLVEAEIDRRAERIRAVRSEQPTVAFEASMATGGESCRDPARRIANLEGAELDASFARRLGGAIGGPLGCSHVLTLAQLLGSTARLCLDAEPFAADAPARRPAERVFERTVTLDGFAGPSGGLRLAVQLADVHFAATPEDAMPLERLSRQYELRIQAEVDLDSMSLATVRGAERVSHAESWGELGWASRDADVAFLAGHPAMGGLARTLLDHFGDGASEAPLRDALLNLAPTIIQCMPAQMERWSRRTAGERPDMLGAGGMTDSCYMWRGDGALAKRTAEENRLLEG